MACPSIFIVYRQIDIIEFTGPGVWSVSDKYQFADKWQKMKGMASKVSCSSRKVGGKTWRPFWRSVKNAQFHPTKHLSRWVLKLEAEWYSTPSIFRLTDIFDFFVSGSPASSKMTTGAMPKHTYGQLSKRSRNLRENSFSWRGTFLIKYPAGFVLFDSGPPCTCWDIVLIVSEVAWPPGTKKLKMSVSRKNTRCRVPFSL